MWSELVPGSVAMFFNDRPGAPVAAGCTTGYFVQVTGFFDLSNGDHVVSGWANADDVWARGPLVPC